MDNQHVDTLIAAAECRSRLHTARVLTSSACARYFGHLSEKARKKLNDAMILLGEVEEEVSEHITALTHCADRDRESPS